MERFCKTLSVFFVLNIAISLNATAQEKSKKIGIGIGYPYVSVKYEINPKYSAELRGASGSGIGIIGIRGYYNFRSIEKLTCFAGGEISRIEFDKSDITGNGYLINPYVGGEYLIMRNITFCMDFGPVYTQLNGSSRYGSVEINEVASGIDLVVDMGLNFYFDLK